MVRNAVTKTASIPPPIKFAFIQPPSITEVLDNAAAALSRCTGGNTDRYNSKEEYLERYPGDEWVFLFFFFFYQRGKDNDKFIKDIDGMFSTLEAIAAEKNKILCQ